MNLHFEQPLILLLALLAIPLLLIGWRAFQGMDTVRRVASLVLRGVLLGLIVFMLAGPHSVREHDHISVIGLVDISGSMRRFADMPDVSEMPGATNIDSLRYWFREATDDRPRNDRIGLVAFDGRATAVSAPTRGDYYDDNLDLPNAEGTNIAEAVSLSLAMLPGDTGRRLVLISDGNETTGSVLEVAREAPGGYGGGDGDGWAGVPIDVVPVEYRVENDVQIVRVEVPPSAQPGQTITARIVMQSTQPASGRLILRREGTPIDLDPRSPGHSRHVQLPQGESVHLAQVTLGDTPINRFEAVFEADDPAMNTLPDNSRAEAFVSTPSRGQVLVLSNNLSDNLLGSWLERADIPVTVQPPQYLPDDLLSLQNYNLIVLENIAAHELSELQHELLARYVDQLGGGLIKSGGQRGFGAGGWMRSAIVDVMPVLFDPPRQLRRPDAGIVLVLDKSGSMNRSVAGARATQQEIANDGAALAIESLHSDNYVGVVTFNHAADVFIPMQRNDNPAELARQVRSIRAQGGTTIQPALELAWDMLREVDVEQNHIVLLTDGISHDPYMAEFVAEMSQSNVPITTIGVGDAIDREQLQMIADGTGSVFHHVRDPRTLPRVLVDSVQEFNKPLLKEVPFEPVVLPTGSTLTIGMDQAPPLGGLVITAPRDDRTAVIEMSHPDGEPLLAQWQAGLGRVAAFTSEIDGRWSEEWIGWDGAQAFWTQLVRTIARPAMSRETELITSIDGDRLRITLEAADQEEGYLDYLQVEGTIYEPDGTSRPVRLTQTAPGRYEGDAPAKQAGSYIVALNPRQGQRQLTPVIGGVSRSTSEEYRRYESNRGMLEEIAEMTGGRVLDINTPREANLFDRADMPRSASTLPLWPTMLVWVLIVLLLDVACRRIAWDYPLVRGMVLKAVARITPARLRSERVLTTLGSLQGVRTRVNQQRLRQAATTEQLRSKRSAPSNAKRVQQSAAAQRSVATGTDGDGQISPATDGSVATASSTQETDGKPAKKSLDSKPPKQEEPSEPGDVRSNLLAAKRRTREEMERKKREG